MNDAIITTVPSSTQADSVELTAEYVTQLNRIRGQIDGIAGMCSQGRPCVEIVRQIMAARSSLATVARGMLSKEAVRCTNDQCLDDLDGIIKELLR